MKTKVRKPKFWAVTALILIFLGGAILLACCFGNVPAGWLVGILLLTGGLIIGFRELITPAPSFRLEKTQR
ncbi:hypothetical protein KKG36_02060 [Patescibacteria group bacterium]|nr:hypothetical protein [Patescibacteria group bacterium]